MIAIDNHVTPEGFATWHKPFQGAYRKGVLAFRSGLALSACPYADKRKGGGQLTWSRAFITAWDSGWRNAEKQSVQREQATTKNQYP